MDYDAIERSRRLQAESAQRSREARDRSDQQLAELRRRAEADAERQKRARKDAERERRREKERKQDRADQERRHKERLAVESAKARLHAPPTASYHYDDDRVDIRDAPPRRGIIGRFFGFIWFLIKLAAFMALCIVGFVLWDMYGR